jgi:hypothetical protein
MVVRVVGAFKAIYISTLPAGPERCVGCQLSSTPIPAASFIRSQWHFNGAAFTSSTESFSSRFQEIMLINKHYLSLYTFFSTEITEFTE